jgi:hypothetical protein
LSIENDLPPEELEGDELTKYLANKKGIPYKEPNPEFLSGDASAQAPVDLELMRKTWPHYPYPESREECHFCNWLKQQEFHEFLSFKIVFKNKDTGELSSMPIVGIEGCDNCGRPLSITKERGIEFL